MTTPIAVVDAPVVQVPLVESAIVVEPTAFLAPISPWKKLDAAGMRWQRPLFGEELYMTWQEMNTKGFLVITTGYSIHNPDLTFEQTVERIKQKWIMTRRTLPVVACKFPVDKKTGNVKVIEYTVPADDVEARQWADETVVVKRRGEYDWHTEKQDTPDRPSGYVAMLRVLEGAGHMSVNAERDPEQAAIMKKKGVHMVLLTVSHSMADVYTICDVGRWMLESISFESPEQRNLNTLSPFKWSDEVAYLPTSLSMAYNHFCGKPTAEQKKQSARYWGRTLAPMMKKQYCALPLREDRPVKFDRPPTEAETLLLEVCLSREETQALLRYSKQAKKSLTALTCGSLLLEVERLSKRNGASNMIGIARNNRRYFHDARQTDVRGSPMPATTATLVEVPLSNTVPGLENNVQHQQEQILQLTNSLNESLKEHVEGTAASLGLANIDALTLPYMAMLQGKVGSLLSWLPSLLSPSMALDLVRAVRSRSKEDAAKGPPILVSSHGSLDAQMPRSLSAGPDSAVQTNAQLHNYAIYTKPGKDTLAILTYTFQGRYQMRITCNTLYYDRAMVTELIDRTMDHLRGFGAQCERTARL